MKKLIIPLYALPLLLLSPIQSFADSQYCREYNQTLFINGKQQDGYGTACLQADGSWKIISEENIGQSSVRIIEPEQTVIIREKVVYPGHRDYWRAKPYYPFTFNIHWFLGDSHIHEVKRGSRNHYVSRSHNSNHYDKKRKSDNKRRDRGDRHR